MSEEQAELELGDSPLRTVGETYREVVNAILKTIMRATANDMVLAHAVAASIEARFRALNHYNLATSIIEARAAEQQAEVQP